MPPNYDSIYVIGPSSSGKTTLCDALVTQIPTKAYLKEIARTVMRERGFSRDDVGEGGKIEMQHAIMLAQLQAESNARQSPAKPTGWLMGWKNSSVNEEGIILCDRSALDPVVYVGWCVASGMKDDTRRNMLEMEEFQRVLPTYRKSLFVLLHPVEEWVIDDGVRSLEQRGLFEQELAEILTKLEIPFKEIGQETKDIQERVELVRGWLGMKDVKEEKRSRFGFRWLTKSPTVA